jgi:transposase-like protein/Zn ribbon nucleic-acid-binding protein
MEFEKQFGNEKDCLEYLFKLRFEDGFVCPKCGNTKYWTVNSKLYECSECGHQTSVVAGTIFQDTHKPLSMWFRAIWWITSQKNGASALGLQRILGLGSYRTAWTWLHKLRRAMVRPNRDKLKGIVEIDETYIGGYEEGGKRGRGTENKVLVIIAVEIDGKKLGRIRMSVIADASQESLHPFIENSIEVGTELWTDGWSGYKGIEEKGYTHTATTSSETDDLLPHVHLVISLLKRWIMGTLQGSISCQHMAYYLDEFTFRFNRRKSKSRGMLFYRLLQQAVQLEPSTYREIVDG